ncbi:fibrinogen-like protein A [Apostichopus japonicus]|uniref:Fibrinogen-like protein A n=1 Tax=Stichopus japonicus TaxID=307972 RepID=A0A2G8JP71_STIJA|nr:fibrinogen-like protein A [Apostichopus japonicus]
MEARQDHIDEVDHVQPISVSTSTDTGYCHSSRSEYRRDCREIYEKCDNFEGRSGTYMIQPSGSPEPFQVYCNNSIDGGSWTVIQRRLDGSVDFYRTWNEYKQGFGFPERDFWLGNDKLSLLTNQKDYELRIDMNNHEGVSYVVKYSLFRVSDEWSKYKLILGDYLPESTAERDSLSYHSNMAFSTYDRDNDLNGGNCPILHGSAWWYNSCDYSDLNADYFAAAGADQSIEWTGLPGGGYNLKFVEMKVRAL